MEGKTYRITIEAIGPEEDELNHGAPVIIETDGFYILTCSRTEDEETIRREIGNVIHRMTAVEIAKGFMAGEFHRSILGAIGLELKKRLTEAV